MEKRNDGEKMESDVTATLTVNGKGKETPMVCQLLGKNNGKERRKYPQ